MLASLSKCKVAALAGALGYTSPVTAEHLRALNADAGNLRMLETATQKDGGKKCASFSFNGECVPKCPDAARFHVEGTKECLAACPPENSFFLDNTTTCVASITLHLSDTTRMNQLFYMQIGTQVGLLAVFFFLALLWKRSNTRIATLPLPASHLRVVYKKNASSGAAQTSGKAKEAEKDSLAKKPRNIRVVSAFHRIVSKTESASSVDGRPSSEDPRDDAKAVKNVNERL